MINPVSFTGYESPLKTMWKRGELPRVKKGLYGEILTRDTLSIEHLVPVSKGGSLTMENVALADRILNSLRGTKDLKDVLTRKQAFEYIEQYIGDKRPIIQKYVEGFFRTLRKLEVL